MKLTSLFKCVDDSDGGCCGSVSHDKVCEKCGKATYPVRLLMRSEFRLQPSCVAVRMRNYEMEEELQRDSPGDAFVVDELCPFNGRFCAFGSLPT